MAEAGGGDRLEIDCLEERRQKIYSLFPEWKGCFLYCSAILSKENSLLPFDMILL